MIDLHIHTVASDGSETPAEIVRLARDKKLKAFSIADHNTVDSLAETFKLAQEARIPFFPAVEIDTLWRDKDLHLLAYGINFSSPACQDWMEEIKTAKLNQTRRRVSRLKELGFKIEYQALMQISRGKMPTGGDYVRALSSAPEGRGDPRVQNYLSGPRSKSPFMNFYLDWLKAGKPAFVPFEEMPCDRAISKAVALSAVPVLAHPSDTPLEHVRGLRDAGLAGIEIYTSYHSPEQSALWKKRAKELGLFITAGSDYHGKNKPDVSMGIECEEQFEILENLSAAIKKSRGVFLEISGGGS